MARGRSELRPEDITVIRDEREKLPYDLAPMQMEPGTLATGDYTVKGLEHLVSVERKSLDDLLGCVGQERERFDRECQRLLAYPTRAIMVEASWADLERGGWRSQITPQAAMGSVLGWLAMGIPIVFAGSREAAQKATGRLLFLAARRRWRELQGLMDGLKLASG